MPETILHDPITSKAEFELQLLVFPKPIAVIPDALDKSIAGIVVYIFKSRKVARQMSCNTDCSLL
jgi:hypothetical protein